MGTPDFAKNILAGLVDSGCDVVAAYTRADAVRGRGKDLVASPVKEYATSQGIPVETPENFNSEDTIATLKQYKPDFIVVAAYGLILPKAVLDIPTYECLNVHGSLLPRWRGAAPVQRAILAGDKEIGYSIMKIGEGLDDGDYCYQNKIENTGQSSTEVFDWMATDSVSALLNCMQSISDGIAQWTAQDDSLATEAAKLQKRELWVAEGDSDEVWFRKILASTPETPAKCKIAGRVVSVLHAAYDDSNLKITAIKPDGKNEMDWKSFVAGIQDKSEENLKWRPVE